MTIYERRGFAECIYSDAFHLHFMLDYFIERFDYFLVCSEINAVIMLNVRTGIRVISSNRPRNFLRHKA